MGRVELATVANASIHRGHGGYVPHPFSRTASAISAAATSTIPTTTPHSPHSNRCSSSTTPSTLWKLCSSTPVSTRVRPVFGDSDFIPPVAKLREHGKHVIGVGAESAASGRLVSVCSQYRDVRRKAAGIG
ncbi:NYN domain-containing protein [Amycolatopsis sp. lyj-112]|uniref:NYN domain-containing protein n=1 Tax=Amycolatopsis sp. lyj-112 TaxID=2789288 RepID=UPI00397E5062